MIDDLRCAGLSDAVASRLLALCERANDLIGLANLDGSIVYQNAAGCALLGLDPNGDITAYNIVDFIAPDERDEIISGATAALLDKGDWEGPVTLMAADGSRIPTWQHLMLIRTAGGERDLVASIVRDQTQQSAVHEQLNATIAELVAARDAHRNSDASVRSILDNAPLPLYTCDRNGHVLYWNSACEATFGYTAADVIGKVPPQIPDDVLATFYEGLRTVFEGQRVLDRGGPRRHADGTELYVKLNAAPLFDADGHVVASVAVIADITAEQRAIDALAASEAALRTTEARYRAVVNDQTELVCRYLSDTTLTFVNSAFAAFYGGDPNWFVGSKLIDIFPEAERAQELARLGTFGPQHPVEIQEVWEPRADGSMRWYQWIDRALFDDDGNVVEFQSVGHDVHERRHAERLMRLQAEILEMVAKGLPLDETLTAITLIAESESGFADLRCSIMLAAPDGFLDGSAAPSLPTELVQAIGRVPIAEGSGSCGTAAFRCEPVFCEDTLLDSSWGSYRDLARRHGIRSCWSTPFRGARDKAIGTLAIYGHTPGLPSEEHVRFVETLARLCEIAVERKEFEDRLAHESMHDPLTGLPNRALLMDRIDNALGRSHRTHDDVALLFLDLDGFKVVNDSHGHAAGDALLIGLAERLSHAVRPGDTVARFGGDEFVVLCEDLPRGEAKDGAIEIARRVLAVLQEPFVVGGAEFFLRASIGIAVGGHADGQVQDLLRDADVAMYNAKDLGKGRWVMFDDAMRQRAVDQHATFNSLHRAIERNEFVVHFQPIMSLTERRCVGAEALVRWNHPERGLVAPDEFIPVAEQSDLIVDIGEWVLEESARLVAQWRSTSSASFTVSVNLSGRQLMLPDLSERIIRIIDRAGVPASSLCFEITESMLMRDTESAITVLDSIKALGARLSIDDFGTGYSSLAYLRRFPVDAVKVDRSFVAGLTENSEDAAIVNAVVNMAHALGLTVVAEGVEHSHQVELLEELGCDFAQGYYFARPQPVTHLMDVIEATNWWISSYSRNNWERSA